MARSRRVFAQRGRQAHPPPDVEGTASRIGPGDDTCQLLSRLGATAKDAVGADDYVTKPFSRDHLADNLHKHLGGHRSSRILVVEDDPETRRWDLRLAPRAKQVRRKNLTRGAR